MIFRNGRESSPKITMLSASRPNHFMFSINGPDNIGKTTQVEMLPSRWGIQRMKGIHEYHKKLSKLTKADALKEWWFATDNRDFVETICDALRRRRESATLSRHPAVFDRGATMFKAVCMARIALFNKVDIASAKEEFSRILKGHDVEWPEEDHSILLTYEGTIEENVTRALELEKNADDQYRAYQILLHQALELQASRGSYSVIIERPGKNCLEVHNEICAWLRRASALNSWSPLLSNVSCIVGFGGLSECGKSTVATATATHYGEEGIRLKIIYFMDLASRELKRNVYDLPENEQAFWLIQEIDRFSSAHKWLRVICIDSLHNFGSSQTLQRVLEGKSLLVYIETEKSVRFSRVNITMEEFTRKDETKISRGADTIKRIADIVVENNGRFEDTVAHVTGAVEAHLTKYSTI